MSGSDSRVIDTPEGPAEELFGRWFVGPFVEVLPVDYADGTTQWMDVSTDQTPFEWSALVRKKNNMNQRNK